MSTAVVTDLQHTVEDAAAHLYVWALKDIPQDLRDALARAAQIETSTSGRRVLEIIERFGPKSPEVPECSPSLKPLAWDLGQWYPSAEASLRLR